MPNPIEPINHEADGHPNGESSPCHFGQFHHQVKIDETAENWDEWDERDFERDLDSGGRLAGQCYHAKYQNEQENAHENEWIDFKGGELIFETNEAAIQADQQET